MKNKKQLPAFLVLTIICLIAALALAATNAVTKGPIEEHAAAARAANFGAVLSATAYEPVERDAKDGVVLVEAWRKGTVVDVLSGATVTSEAVINAVNTAVEAEGLTASAKGFQSDVTVTVALDDKGLISGLTIDSASETPNFGTRCAADEAFIAQFVGKAAPFVRTEGLVGYCVSASETGYAGDVAVTLGVNLDGEIVGAKIGDNNFRETGTIGGKWLAEDKVEQFIGIDLVNGGAIDTIAGATITSDAVKGAANKGANVLRAHLNIESDTPVFGEPKPVEYADSVAAGDYSVTGAGFQSNVKVDFTVDENSTITALTMDTSGETQGYGTRCGEDEGFVSQFVGKTVPVTEFDVLSGATITSNAVVTAINSIAVAGGDEPSVEASAEVPAVEGGALTASAKGLLSDVKVTVTLAADGTIETMVVDASGETQAIAAPCTEEAFLSQFIGKKGPFEGADVVSGATFTSNAVINAVNSLFPAEEAAPAGNALTASAKGLLSDVKVTVTLAADGTIETMVVDASGETQAIAAPCTEEAFLSQFVGKKGPFEGADVVSGATFTSNAVINAVNSLFPAEEAAPAGNELTASAKGLLSDVKVTVTLAADGTIETMVVDASGETQAIAAPCTEEAFLSQFIGKKGPFEGADVVSGATFTSNAVINAVNSLFPVQDMSTGAEEAPVATELTASAKGLLSDVKVTVTLAADGTIETMVVDASGETEAIAKPCTEEAFLSQFIGKKGPFEGADVVSGATFTSNAVINAVNSLFPAEEAAPAGNELTASAKGLLSDVKVTITLATDGTIETMVVDASGETQAIAAPCTEEAFLSQFIGKKGPFEGADVVSGATFTSNAVINAVNSLFPAEEVAPAGNELTASAKGLLSDVKVTVTLAADGTIETMVVDASGETQAIAAPCTEEAFLSQFVGKKGPFEGADVVSGATFTSNAVINAVNSLFPVQDMSTGTEEAPVATELTASAKGLLSDVKVTITLAADGTIETMVVDASGETEAIAAPCTEEAFLSQFIGKKGPFEGADVVSGATFTSNAVINAVNSLFPVQDMSTGAEEAPVATELTASAKGLLSDVKVTVTLAADGTIETMVVDASGETEAIAKPCTEEAFLSQFIGKKGPFEGADVVSGATFTSNAVINAVNSLFPVQDMSTGTEEAPVATELTASAKGLLSDVKVTVTLAADGTIETMVVDASGETQAIAAPCTEEAFLSQFIGKKGPFEGADVVSGATFTSNAVINAVNSLFAE